MPTALANLDDTRPESFAFECSKPALPAMLPGMLETSWRGEQTLTVSFSPTRGWTRPGSGPTPSPR